MLDRLRLPRGARYAVPAAALVLLFPALAGGGTWAQQYVSNQIFNPDGIGLSAFNSVHENILNWYGQQGPAVVMQATLCDASYSCYPYVGSNSGNIDDTRTISYGRAKCHEKADQIYQAFVRYCTANNF